MSYTRTEGNSGETVPDKIGGKQVAIRLNFDQQPIIIVTNDNEVAYVNGSTMTLNILLYVAFVIIKEVSATRISRVQVVHDIEAHLVCRVIFPCK